VSHTKEERKCRRCARQEFETQSKGGEQVLGGRTGALGEELTGPRRNQNGPSAEEA
jgi:hypothetical protein